MNAPDETGRAERPERVAPAARRARLVLAYDGTEFAGWQIQPAARTVQGVLAEALTRLAGGAPVAVRGASRTDAGVHACGQVADARLATRLSDDGLERALRSVLPRDLRVLEVRTVDDAFHARYDAIAKTYRYCLDLSPAGNPFLARYALHHPAPIDETALDEALSRLPGRRDWSGFAGAACEVENRVRCLIEARWSRVAGNIGVFTFTADGFLTHMARNLVGTLLEIARGGGSPDRIDAILRSRDRRLAGPTAPASGLCLERVVYEGDASRTGGPTERGSLDWYSIPPFAAD